MKPRSMVLAGLVALLAHPVSLLGQSPQVGDAVRFRDRAPTSEATASWRGGELQQLKNDTLWVRVSESVVPVSLLDVEAQARTGNRRAKGFWIGVAAGAVVGGMVGAVTYEPRFSYGSLGEAIGCAVFVGCAPPPQRNSRLGDTIGAAAGVGLLGGGLGWLVGRAFPKWARLDAARVTSGAVHLSGRIGY